MCAYQTGGGTHLGIEAYLVVDYSAVTDNICVA